MSPALAPAAPVRHGETLTYDQLRERAALAFSKAEDRDGLTRTALAERLKVSLPTVSRALTESGGRYANVQRKIIADLTGYSVAEEPEFRVKRGEG